MFPCRAAAAAAEEMFRDRVVIRPEGATGRVELQCSILDYTGRTLRIKTVSGDVRSYPTSRVVDVQTPQTQSHVQGLVDFTRGRYADAVEKFKSALAVEERQWVRRELLAMLVRCALKQSDLLKAARRFVLIVDSDPSTQHYALIPLVWSARPISAALKAQARQWLLADEPTPRLIAASIMLSDSRDGDKALKILKRLRFTSDSRISTLAKLQLWRDELRKGTPTKSDVQLWQKRIEGMPSSLRAGGYYLLGRAHQLRRENEPAAAAYLWLPLVYDDDHLLAARACVNAAESLLEAGRKRAAVTLYREVQVRFSETEFAQEAHDQLKQLTSSTSSSGGP